MTTAAFSFDSCPISMYRLAWTATLVLLATCSLSASEPPPTADDVQNLMTSHPLTAESWPRWRDYFVRLQWQYDVDEPQEFYEQLANFFGEKALENGGKLPTEWAEDPIAWACLSSYWNRVKPPSTEAAVEAGRRALEVGDPAGISSSHLAVSLLYDVRARFVEGDEEVRRKLDEAEALLDNIHMISPQARLNHWRGLAAWYRGDKSAALKLLRLGADERPDNSAAATVYLLHWLQSEEAVEPVSETTGIYAERFPDDGHIATLHAAALYRNAHYPESYRLLCKAREINPEALRIIGPEAVAAIEEDRWFTPQVMEGLELVRQKSHGSAAEKFREALESEPENNTAARFLARSLLAAADSKRLSPPSSELERIVAECVSLCGQFSDDPELQVALSGALFRAGRSEDAEAALQRAEDLGGNLEELAGLAGKTVVRDAARWQRTRRRLWFGVLGGAGASAAWVSIMFALGTVLAMSTSRIPNITHASLDVQSVGEIWLNRFYFVVLGLSLVFFYMSVPFVAAGLLAITLILFGFMLALRILHFGLLYRGLYATWGVLRAAFVGPSSEVFGVQALPQDHPELWRALDDVASRLETPPVAEVYLTPDSAVGVREDGKGPFGLFRRKRVMQIGLATLSHVNLGEFKAILAHEFGHYTQHDPFYTRFIFQVTASLDHSLAVMQATAGFVNYLNPFFWFYWLYLRAYALLASGFSRSREFLADRRAVSVFGKESFSSGLAKAAVDGHLMEQMLVPNVQAAIQAGEPIRNVFEVSRAYTQDAEFPQVREKALDELRSAKPGWFDSHPTYSERVTAVDRFSDTPEYSDDRPALHLLSEPDEVEVKLTELLTRIIRDANEIALAMSQGNA